MDGLHLTADLRGCAASRPEMSDSAALRDTCLAAVEAAGLHAVGELFHRFGSAPAAGHTRAPGPGPQAGGVTGVVLLAESHAAVHTWPELGAVTIDVYVCNLGSDNSRRAERLMQRLIDAFAPAAVTRHALRRGAPAGAA
jgi:S-adenosylmethionine/arginine decarboxylase-like enzyme